MYYADRGGAEKKEDGDNHPHWAIFSLFAKYVPFGKKRGRGEKRNAGKTK